MADIKKIGLLVGREWSFPPAFLEEVNSRNVGVLAEYAKLGGTRMNEPIEYDLIIDRISHEVPYYRTYLKNAVLQGTYVINNPFWWSADDKFFESSLADALGVPTPRTIALPMKSYPEGVVSESLRNLIYPLDWDGIVEYVGLPAVLKDAWGGTQPSYTVNSVDELIHAYDRTGQLCMMVQEFIEWDLLVQCFCIGEDTILPVAHDAGKRGYPTESDDLDPTLVEQLLHHARTLNRALGYDMNSIEFAVRDGVPYAIDFMNAAPELDVNRLTPRYFQQVVEAMADFCIEMLQNPRLQRVEHHWAQFLPS